MRFVTFGVKRKKPRKKNLSPRIVFLRENDRMMPESWENVLGSIRTPNTTVCLRLPHLNVSIGLLQTHVNFKISVGH